MFSGFATESKTLKVSKTFKVLSYLVLSDSMTNDFLTMPPRAVMLLFQQGWHSVRRP
jgi:hypothetical protein